MPVPSRERLIPLAALALLVALPPVAQAFDHGFYIGLATRVLAIALAAASLDLILGYGGLVSFGHAAFVGLGAYVVGILATHHSQGTPVATLAGVAIPGSVDAVVVWPLAMLVSGLAALAIGAVSLRTSGIGFIMITLAFAQMLYYLFVGLRRYGGADGISLWSRSELGGVLDLNRNTTLYYVVLAALAGFLFVGRRLVGSRFGMVIRGARDNERRMRALGFPTRRYCLAAFALAGAVAGLAGALLANATEFVGPGMMAWHRSGELIAMVVLGGMGTLYGPVLGAAALLLLEDILAEYTEHWALLLGPLLVLVVLYARGGLYGLVRGRGGDGRG